MRRVRKGGMGKGNNIISHERTCSVEVGQWLDWMVQ